MYILISHKLTSGFLKFEFFFLFFEFFSYILLREIGCKLRFEQHLPAVNKYNKINAIKNFKIKSTVGLNKKFRPKNNIIFKI